MVQLNGFVTAATTLLCLGQTLVVIDSLSTMKFSSQRSTNTRFQIWKRKTAFHQCPNSHNDRVSSSRLFSISDFSSHPYSVYYGTSGSTAKQNFNQNDDINDVYGYGPDDLPRQESYNRNEDRSLQSMQDIPLFGGRRGATVFGTKYDEGRHPLDYDQRVLDEREQMFHENRMIEDRIEDQHDMMDQMDSLLCERDDLRMQLDAVVNDNIRLQDQQKKINDCHPSVPSGQNQHYQETNPMASSCRIGQDQSTRSVMDSVMDELKNMQRTVQAVEAGQQGRNANGGSEFINSSPVGSESQSVENIISELEATEQTLQNLSSEQASYNYDSSTGDDSQQEYTNGDCSASAFEQPHNFNDNGEEAQSGSVNGYSDSIKQDRAAEMFAGEYEVVIKAELKKKNGVKHIDVHNNAMEESPTISGETFGSKYI